jgi:hypothetical protein
MTLRQVIDELANALQAAIGLSGQVRRQSARTSGDAAHLERRLPGANRYLVGFFDARSIREECGPSGVLVGVGCDRSKLIKSEMSVYRTGGNVMYDAFGPSRFALLTRGRRYAWRGALVLLLASSGLLLGAGRRNAAADEKKINFDMLASAGAMACLPNASAEVTIEKHEGAEAMEIKVTGLAPRAVFNVFVIQKPTAPFGISWYQGDISTNPQGDGHGRFLGRFNNETFIVAPGSAPAPKPHAADASINPSTAPVHMYHLGLWFDSPADATAAGCPATVTPFNGDHTAGIQVLNTRNFPDLVGPLSLLD